MAGLFGGWFLAFTLIKGSDPLGNIDDTSLLRLLIPAIPAFVLMLAALPLLAPGVARRLPRPAPPRAWRSPAAARTAITAAALLFVVVPVALAARAHRLPPASTASITVEAGPIPTDPALRLEASVSAGRVRLSWAAADGGSGQTFYIVLRGSECAGATDLDLCQTQSASSTRATSAVDVPPAAGRYVYTVAVSANWQDEPTGGDPYVASLPVAVTVP